MVAVAKKCAIKIFREKCLVMGLLNLASVPVLATTNPFKMGAIFSSGWCIIFVFRRV